MTDRSSGLAGAAGQGREQAQVACPGNGLGPARGPARLWRRWIHRRYEVTQAMMVRGASQGSKPSESDCGRGLACTTDCGIAAAALPKRYEQLRPPGRTETTPKRTATGPETSAARASRLPVTASGQPGSVGDEDDAEESVALRDAVCLSDDRSRGPSASHTGHCHGFWIQPGRGTCPAAGRAACRH